ncbi:hypothetical protein E4695_16210 [Alcaligenaceae bacterium 429]|nr:hypothetical protein E4695_16210 [Alcaligenaceae bacterium 429]
MISYLATGSIYSIQQLGITAAAGGIFAIAYVMALTAIILAITLSLWGLWRYTKAKQGEPRPPLSLPTRLIVTLIAIYPIWFGITYAQIWYSNYQLEQSRLAENLRRFGPLEQTTQFGEMQLVAGTLINRGDPWRFKELPQQDPLLDLEAVRFQEPTAVAGVLAYAMSIEGSSLTIELAQEYQLDTPELSRHCPVGYVLMFPFPDRRIRAKQRLEPPYTWFTPSQWEPTSCFQSTNGVMVMDMDQHGIYFPKDGAPYTPRK